MPQRSASGVQAWLPARCRSLPYGLALLAFRLGATPRLAALRETSILFGTAIAVIFLKESLTKIRAAGVAAIAFGAMTLIAAR